MRKGEGSWIPGKMDDELDDLLEQGLAKNAAQVEPPPSRRVEAAPAAGVALSFSFPGWGLDFCRDTKRSRASIVRHSGQEIGNEEGKESQFVKSEKDFRLAAAPQSGCPVLETPDAVLLQILGYLSMKDLCSSRQACRKWYNLCSLDFVWDKFLTSKCKLPVSLDVPKWLVLKNWTLSANILSRYTYKEKWYEVLMEALDAWWDLGLPSGRYASSLVCPVIRKMTLSDWCLVYDTLGAAFQQRASHVGSELQLEKQRSLDEPAGLVGMNLWEKLSKYWRRYIAWIKLVCLHCADLRYAIRLENRNTPQTPTLYNKGIICFRSEVLLCYGLRQVLQEGLVWLSRLEFEGSASDQEIELLCSLHHLLQELDVPDDYTLPSDSHTQMKLRRCFLDGNSSKQHSRAQILAARMDY